MGSVRGDRERNEREKQNFKPSKSELKTRENIMRQK